MIDVKLDGEGMKIKVDLNLFGFVLIDVKLDGEGIRIKVDLNLFGFDWCKQIRSSKLQYKQAETSYKGWTQLLDDGSVLRIFQEFFKLL